MGFRRLILGGVRDWAPREMSSELREVGAETCPLCGGHKGRIRCQLCYGIGWIPPNRLPKGPA